MAKVLQLRHGTTAEHANFTGTLAEVTVDTDLKTIRVHDGSTAGGHILAKFAEVVRSVNSAVPDANGNVTIDTGGVKTVNSKSPDSNGNVVISDFIFYDSLGLSTFAASPEGIYTVGLLTCNASDSPVIGSHGLLTTVVNGGTRFQLFQPDIGRDIYKRHYVNGTYGAWSILATNNYNNLINRPSIPATPKAYVTTTWRSGTSWYRKWSDGFIEQGGYSTDRTREKTITFHISFTSTVCNIALGGYGGGGTPMGAGVTAHTLTNFTYLAHFYADNDANKLFWYACGF